MIIVRIWEGLGNQLFQYAFAKALQLERKEKVYLDIGNCNGTILNSNRTPREYQLSKFKITMKSYEKVEKYYFFLGQNNIIERNIKKLAEKGIYPYKYFKEETVAYAPDLFHLQGNYYVQGWFQNERYFKKYEDVIRKEFRLKEKIKISKELRDILQIKNTVAIHIRRGDYKKLFNVLPKAYYENAIQYMNEKIENPFFCVFSDEIEWVKRNMKLPAECYYVNEDQSLKDYEELMVMSRCRHQIIANSTFSWWGAWLNDNADKIVVGPKLWFPPKDRNAGLDIMPNEWIRL